MYMDQESGIRALEGYHNKLLLLHKQTWEEYEVKKLGHRVMKIELSQHQGPIRDVSGGRSAKARGVHQLFFHDKVKTRLTEHLPKAAREPRRPMDS